MKNVKRKHWEAALFAAALCISAAVLVVYTLRGTGGFALPSLVIALLFLIPFFVHFERNRPPAGLLVCISVMGAIAALSRVLFVAFASVKPTTAIVLVTGIAFGPGAGFLTGALAALASNVYFVQGPWTPWQMLAWGLCGLAGGLLRERKFLKSPWWLSLTGALLSLAFGVIMNLSYVIPYVRPLTFPAVMTAMGAGLAFDSVHAVSTFVFLLLFGRLWLKKLLRVQEKLGE